VEIQRSLISRNPDDLTLKYRYVLPQQNLLRLQAELGQVTGYSSRCEEVQRLSDELVAHDAANLDWQAALEMTLLLQGQGHELRGELDSALTSTQAAMQIAERIFHADPGQSLWRLRYVTAANGVANLSFDLSRNQAASAALDATKEAAQGLSGSEAVLVAAATNALLRLELGRRLNSGLPEQERIALATRLDELQRHSPPPGVVEGLRLRLAALESQPVAPAPLLHSLPSCSLEYRRLARFLERSGASPIPQCPVAST
jgi:hypothetical protein